MTAPACGSCGAPVNDARLCTGCTRELAKLLLTAASIATDLDDAVAKLLRRGSGGKRSADENPLPLDLAASAVSARFAAVLRYWTRELHGQAAGAAHMANWLHAHVKEARQHPQAADMLRAVRRANASAEAVVDIKPGRVYAGPCTRCGADLLGDPGTPVIQCACGTVHEVSERRAALQAAMLDLLGSASWCAATASATGVLLSEHTVRTWAKRKKLTPHGEYVPLLGDGQPHPVYRFGDVLELAAKRPQRA